MGNLYRLVVAASVMAATFTVYAMFFNDYYGRHLTTSTLTRTSINRTISINTEASTQPTKPEISIQTTKPESIQAVEPESIQTVEPETSTQAVKPETTQPKWKQCSEACSIHPLHAKNLLPVWPIPKQVSLKRNEDQPISLSGSLEFKTESTSDVVKDAIERYKKLNSREDDCGFVKVTEIDTVIINVRNNSELLNIDTDYAYALGIDVTTKEATVSAVSPFGAIYGLETLSQLFFNHSCIPYSHVYIKDQPTYKHRGLLLDVARRQAPMKLVFDVIDSLSYLKMNVLHLHLSDHCKFSIKSKIFPQLVTGLEDSQYFTIENIKDIIEYARLRGIRVIPEVDIPGHARSLRFLNGEHLEFCDDSYNEIYNDPQKKSVNTLKKLFLELINLFPDQYIHMGGDETNKNEKCTLQGLREIETEIAKYIISLGRIPIAWEEALFRTNTQVPGMVSQIWNTFTTSSAIDKGYYSIESNYKYFYLDIKPRNHFPAPWLNIAPARHKEKLLGGELAMWADNYRKSFKCQDEEAMKKDRDPPTWVRHPLAPWMFQPQYDKEFSKSLMGLIWPVGLPAAGTFWNFSPTNSYQLIVDHVNQVLISRGIEACPNGCVCDELERCGVKYKKN